MAPVTSPAVAGAFRAVARRGFLPPDLRDAAEHDGPLPIGHGQTNSQPWTVAYMLELLDVRPGQRVLDVGAGSGWTTALLAHLVGASGEVIGVERVPALTAFGRANLAAYRFGWARIEQARPGVLGWPDAAPYDRILVSAMAETLPLDLVEQLAPGGIMVIPVAGEMVRVRREGDELSVERSGGFVFVPLVRD
nr:protein-L-isoaspartate O-methyltransferase [Propionibacterium sp.]